MFSALRCSHCRRVYRPVVSARGRVGADETTEVIERGSRQCPECDQRTSSSNPTKPEIAEPILIGSAAPLKGSTHEGIIGLKYRNDRRVVGVLAKQLAASIRQDGADSSVEVAKFDLVTWAPTSARRQRKRGYDQSELLAKAVALELGLKCRRMLYRDRSGPQTGRNRQQRLDGPIFRARPLRNPARILVIDDVVTTGSTLRAAAHALELAGAHDVRLFAVAATPVRRGATSWPES